MELLQYRKEMRRRPVMINTATAAMPASNLHKGRRRKSRSTAILYKVEPSVTDAEQVNFDLKT